MSKKEIIVTNTLGYKIYNFFRKIFSKNKDKKVKQDNSIKGKKNKDNQDFLKNISYRNEIENLDRKKKIAKQLMTGELSIKTLSDEEVDEMTDYFNIYIIQMNQKLDKIKKHIID